MLIWCFFGVRVKLGCEMILLFSLICLVSIGLKLVMVCRVVVLLYFEGFSR